MAMTAAEALFVDTNALVYANVAESPFHEQALGTLRAAHQAGRRLWISRQVLREYLVTMTRPQAFPGLSRATVLDQVGQFAERFAVADETAAVTAQLHHVLGEVECGGKQVDDANVVATMLAYDIPCLLTHNRQDFQCFDGLITIEPIG